MHGSADALAAAALRAARARRQARHRSAVCLRFSERGCASVRPGDPLMLALERSGDRVYVQLSRRARLLDGGVCVLWLARAQPECFFFARARRPARRLEQPARHASSHHRQFQAWRTHRSATLESARIDTASCLPHAALIVASHALLPRPRPAKRTRPHCYNLHSHEPGSEARKRVARAERERKEHRLAPRASGPL